MLIKLNITDLNNTHIFYFPCLVILATYYAFQLDLFLSLSFVLLSLYSKRIAGILEFSKLHHDDHEIGGQLTLIISEGGAVRLESPTKGKIEGYLGSYHWCTRHLAVIRLVISGRVHHLVALSLLQEKPESFRRLNMWLRQEFYPEAGNMPTLGSTHDKGILSFVKWGR